MSLNVFSFEELHKHLKREAPECLSTRSLLCHGFIALENEPSNRFQTLISLKSNLFQSAAFLFQFKFFNFLVA